MAPVYVDPTKIREFPSRESFELWLAAHHADTDELWLKLHKKGSGLPSVSAAEALDVVLCWGWIDAIRKSFDDRSFLQRYVPRAPKGHWSKINVEHVERLTREGRMQPPGLAQVAAAQADGRWDRAYAGARTMELPEDLLSAIAAEPDALQTFSTLNSVNRFALGFRLHALKTEAGRRKRIAGFVEMLKRGETPHPNGKAK